MMAPLEGFDSGAGDKDMEINNNIDMQVERQRAPVKPKMQQPEEPEVEDLGQKLLKDQTIQENDLVEAEAKKRVAKGRELVWLNIVLIPLFHFVAVYAIIFHLAEVKWQTFVWGFALGGLGGFGVTAGVHRMWSHRAYKGKLPLRIFLALCYSIAGHNSIYDWVRDHRVHHKFTETDADPHNVKRGFFFAHVGWLMMKKHPEVLRQGRKVDMSDIMADPVVRIHQKYFLPLKLLMCFFLPIFVPRYMWDETWTVSILSTAFVRYVMLLNFTWLVNSAAHMFGNKPYDNRINPTENLAVSIVAMGEGWHNYHHVFPWDYKASEYSYYFNLTTFYIDLFAKLGLAYDLKHPSKDMVRRVIQRHGDGSHPKHGRNAQDHHHPEEVTYEEYLKAAKEDDEHTGVRDLHNETDITRKQR